MSMKRAVRHESDAGERRIHQVFVTQNTEYHLRRARCIGVRDRRTGEWVRGHLALRTELTGGVRFFDNGGMHPTRGLPEVGESLLFTSPGRDLVTSPLQAVERPPRDTVQHYSANFDH